MTPPSGSNPRRSELHNDPRELERFRHDIDLIAFAASKGYAIDKQESQRNRCIMRRGREDKIEISKAGDGHWQFYSWYDDRDKGDIIQFVQNRAGGSVDPGRGRFIYPLGRVRKELREWTHTEREIPEYNRTLEPVHKTVKDRDAVAAEYAAARVVRTHWYLESRGISASTLGAPRFRDTWRQASDAYRNVLFPHHDLEGRLSGFEKNNRGFTRFSSGGEKGLWSSRLQSTDERLVIAESAIDALSYAEVNPHPKTRYSSFAGGLNAKQPDIIERAISWMPAGSAVIAATDRDAQGDKFAKRIADLCAAHCNVRFDRHVPTLGEKDWNDHLRELRGLDRQPRTKTQGLER